MAGYASPVSSRTRSAVGSLKLAIASAEKVAADEKKDLPPLSWAGAVKELLIFLQAQPEHATLSDIQFGFMMLLQERVPLLHMPIMLKVFTQYQIDLELLRLHERVNWTRAALYVLEAAEEPELGNAQKAKDRMALMQQAIQMFPYKAARPGGGGSGRRGGGKPQQGPQQGGKQEQPKKV